MANNMKIRKHTLTYTHTNQNNILLNKQKYFIIDEVHRKRLGVRLTDRS